LLLAAAVESSSICDGREDGAMPTREPIAIQFSDLREFTAITAERGDEEAFRLARAFVELVESHVVDHGGRVLKTYGDGVMTSFEDALQSVECSIEMQNALCAEYCRGEETTLSAGIGLTWGTAIRTEDDLFGSSVNLAKRIADVAKGGQIVVSSTVAQHATLAETGHSFRDLGARSLKGLGDHRLYELVWRNEIAKLGTAHDDVEFVLTEDDKLVIGLAKPAQEELREVQERLAVLGKGEGGLEGMIKRAIGKRVARKLPSFVEWAASRAGMGMEHELKDVEVRVHEGKLTLFIKGRKRVTLGEEDIDLSAAERFADRLEALKRGTRENG
jgi:class 3 adenylate cyclase